MPSFTPRQVAVRAQEAASQLVAALDGAALVPKFLRGYVDEKKRPGRTANPQRYRDLIETIRREALLVMVLQVDIDAPRRLGMPRTARAATPRQVELADLFRGEFYVALGRRLNWDDEEFAAFCRDLDLFRKLYADVPRVSHRSRALAPCCSTLPCSIRLVVPPPNSKPSSSPPRPRCSRKSSRPASADNARSRRAPSGFRQLAISSVVLIPSPRCVNQVLYCSHGK